MFRVARARPHAHITISLAAGYCSARGSLEFKVVGLNDVVLGDISLSFFDERLCCFGLPAGQVVSLVAGNCAARSSLQLWDERLRFWMGIGLRIFEMPAVRARLQAWPSGIVARSSSQLYGSQV